MKDYWRQREPKMLYDEDDDIIGKILKIRGVEDREEFLRPSDLNLHEPFELENLEEICVKIKEAIDNKKKIGIYGD